MYDRGPESFKLYQTRKTSHVRKTAREIHSLYMQDMYNCMGVV